MAKKPKILVTGGAGFIGSFLVDELVKRGYSVRIFDNLEEQVHHGKKPQYLNKKAEFVKGDIRDRAAFLRALKGCEVVYHLASAVGVGQSQYQIEKYIGVNVGGAATLMDVIVNEKLPIKKIIYPGSMTGYGEGNYRCSTHGEMRPGIRPESQLKKRIWEPLCLNCGRALKNIPIKENAATSMSSVYALSKHQAEDIIATVGSTYSIPYSLFRFFNVYGPRQSLSNPYTGVSAIFVSRIKSGNAPVIYEDGLQSRDFISVHDVVDILCRALTSAKADNQIFNVGSGVATSVRDLALMLAKLLGSDVTLQITGKYRPKDIRHCVADISKAKRMLNWKPKVSLKSGMKELITWAESEKSFDSFAKADRELASKGLVK